MSNGTTMKPTAKMRWLRLHGNDIGLGHPSGLNQGNSPYFMVLQQWWEQVPEHACDEGDWKLVGEWRDIPIETAE